MGKNKRSFSKNALGKKKVIEIGKQIKSKPKLDKTSAKGRSKTSETGKKPVKRNQEKDIFALAREAPSKTVKKMIMSIHG